MRQLTQVKFWVDKYFLAVESPPNQSGMGTLSPGILQSFWIGLWKILSLKTLENTYMQYVSICIYIVFFFPPFVGHFLVIEVCHVSFVLSCVCPISSALLLFVVVFFFGSGSRAAPKNGFPVNYWVMLWSLPTVSFFLSLVLCLSIVFTCLLWLFPTSLCGVLVFPFASAAPSASRRASSSRRAACSHTTWVTSHLITAHHHTHHSTPHHTTSSHKLLTTQPLTLIITQPLTSNSSHSTHHSTTHGFRVRCSTQSLLEELSCGRRRTQNLREELVRAWAPLGRGWLSCGRRNTQSLRWAAAGFRVAGAVHQSFLEELACAWAPLGALGWPSHHLWHTIFGTHNFVTHHLWHTIFHTIFDTPSFTPLCHTPSLAHHFVTHHFVTHQLSHHFVTHYFSHTHTHSFVTHHLSHIHTTLSHPLFHTQLSHNFVTHHLWHTVFESFTHHLWHTIFYTPSFTHNFATHHLSHIIFHTTLSHTIFHTSSLTHHLLHTIFHTPSLTPHLWHTPSFTHRHRPSFIHHLSHTTLSHTQLFHTPSFLHLLLCFSFLPRPRFNISCWLLEELGLWVVRSFYFYFSVKGWFVC